MNSDSIKEILLKTGAITVGTAKAAPVAEEAEKCYAEWLKGQKEAGMAYMHNYASIRRDPRELLPGARSIICMAFGYETKEKREPTLPYIAEYALSADYHKEIRKKIRRSGIGEYLGEEGKDWRICIDSAPIMERYWAVKSGLGIIGDNGAVIVRGYGSKVFLSEIVTTADIEEDETDTGDCGHCGQCHKVCPTGALRDGIIDCNLCLSYLTIEHRGVWEKDTHKKAMHTSAGRSTLFGCDRCITVCPHNRNTDASSYKPEALPGILHLTKEDILHGEPDMLREQLRRSCLKRAKREGLERNAENLDNSCEIINFVRNKN